MRMKQDAFLLKDTSRVVNSPPHVAMSNGDASDYPLRGEAQVAPKKKGGKTKKGKKAPSPVLPANQPTNVATPNRINSRTGHRNRCFGCGSEFHLLPQCPGPTPKAARRVSIAMDPPGGGDQDATGGGVWSASVSPGWIAGHSVSESAGIFDAGA